MASILRAFLLGLARDAPFKRGGAFVGALEGSGSKVSAYSYGNIRARTCFCLAFQANIGLGRSGTASLIL